MTTGKKIRKARKTQNVTRRDLADAVGVSHTYISKVENERAEPSRQFLKNVARALSLPLAHFIIGPTVTPRDDGCFYVTINDTGNRRYVSTLDELRALRAAIDAALGDAKVCDVCEKPHAGCGAGCDGWK